MVIRAIRRKTVNEISRIIAESYSQWEEPGAEVLTKADYIAKTLEAAGLARKEDGGRSIDAFLPAKAAEVAGTEFDRRESGFIFTGR